MLLTSGQGRVNVNPSTLDNFTKRGFYFDIVDKLSNNEYLVKWYIEGNDSIGECIYFGVIKKRDTYIVL